MPNINLTAIDPSINHIGIAHLVAGRIESAKTIHTKMEGDDRYAEIFREVSGYFMLADLPSQPVVIEYPNKWSRRNVESLLKLTTAIGAIIGAVTLSNHEVYLIKTVEWKGKKKKIETFRELQMQGYDTTALGWDEHGRDAAALALAAEGVVRIRRATRG